MKKTGIIMVVAVVLIIAAFYGGDKYGQSQATKNLAASRANFANRGGVGGVGGVGNQNRRISSGANFVSGQVISTSTSGLTLKLDNGGSKNIFLSPSTEITKSVNGVAADLVIGQNLMVNGTSTTDGSLTATMIQIRQNNLNPGGPRNPGQPGSANSGN